MNDRLTFPKPTKKGKPYFDDKALNQQIAQITFNEINESAYDGIILKPKHYSHLSDREAAFAEIEWETFKSIRQGFLSMQESKVNKPNP